MSQVRRWRFWCVDEKVYKFAEQATAPTACPVSGEHTIKDLVIEENVPS